MKSHEGTAVADDQLMTLEDLAAYLGVSKRTVYNWRYHGEGPPGFRLGRGQVRYRRAEVDAWLEQQRDDRPADVPA